MDQFTVDIFIDEIKRQSLYALMSYNEMVNVLNDTKGDRSIFWYYTSSFLSATANVSKLLGGNKEGTIYNQRKTIRDYFNLENDDLMIHVREVRNAFDHYDSRIDEWAENVPQRIYITNAIASKEDIEVQGMSTDNYMRFFNPKTGILSVLTSEMDIYKAAKELEYLYKFKPE